MVWVLIWAAKNKYDQEIPKSHTADQPTALGGRATEHLHSFYIAYKIKVN